MRLAARCTSLREFELCCAGHGWSVSELQRGANIAGRQGRGCVAIPTQAALPLGVVRGAARPRWRIPCTVTARDAPVTGRTVTRTPVLLRGQHMASCRGPGVPGCGRANKQSSAAGRCGGAWRRWRRRRLSARVPSRTAAPRREPARMTSEPGGTLPSRRGTRTAVGLGRGRRAAGLVLLGLREGVQRAARGACGAVTRTVLGAATPRRRDAVTHGDGPALVDNGQGTGHGEPPTRQPAPVRARWRRLCRPAGPTAGEACCLISLDMRAAGVRGGKRSCASRGMKRGFEDGVPRA